jgi:predicted RNA polymerase sigma factor
VRRGEPAASVWWVERDLIDAHLARARALHALGRDAEAREAYGRAITTLTRLVEQHTFVVPPRWLADARAELAALGPAPR